MLKLDAPPANRWMTRGTAVPSWQMRDTINKYLPRLNAEANLGSANSAGIQTGGLQLLALRTSIHTDTTPDTILRHINRIRTDDSTTCEAHVADCILLALGSSFAEEGIAVIPACGKAALEMVETYEDVCGDHRFSKGMKTPKQLAQSLTNFSTGFLYSDRALLEIEELDELVA